jgi:uncharacterized coiled-coil DUF342 family protein
MPPIKRSSVAKPSAEEVWNALNDVRRSLNDAYWHVSDQNAADRLLSTAQEIDRIQDAIDQGEIDANSDKYKELAAQMTVVSGRLDEARSKIDDLVHNIEIAGKVVRSIEKAISLAAKYFA